MYYVNSTSISFLAIILILDKYSRDYFDSQDVHKLVDLDEDKPVHFVCAGLIYLRY